MKDWVAIFRSGNHTDSAGNPRTWTDEDIDKMISTFDMSTRQVPVVIGHPKTDAPAWGWVSSLKRVGDTLYAMFSDLAPAFTDAVKAGRFRSRSISVDVETKRLRHVGFLGAALPAVEGLPQMTFTAADDTAVVEYKEEANMLKNLSIKERLKAAFAAGKDADIDAILSGAASADGSELQPANHAEPETPVPTAQPDKKYDELKKALDTETAARRAAERKAGLAEFAAKLDAAIKEGRFLPAMKDTAMAVAEAIVPASGEFSAASNGMTALMAMIASMPVVVPQGHIAGQLPATANYAAPSGYSVDTGELELHQKITAYAAKHNVAYIDAAIAIERGAA